LSFHPVKQITTGEGGALLTNSEEIFQTALKLRSHGVRRESSPRPDDPMWGPWSYEQDALGFNYRITDIQCALGLSQLKKLDSFVAQRRSLASRYDAALASAPLAKTFAPLRQLASSRSAYHLYVVQLKQRPGESLESVAQRRHKLFAFLQERNIFPQVHYIPIHWQPFHRDKTDSGEPCPGAASYYASSLSLPLFSKMTESDVDVVVTALAAFAQAG
jgi:dTDP-4-amino-4,6-dideoxygalactose transaminase